MVVLIFNIFSNSISWLGSYYVPYYMVLLFLWLFTMSLFWMDMPCLKRREESWQSSILMGWGHGSLC